jgi:uncharacterized protein (DUF169 family)
MGTAPRPVDPGSTKEHLDMATSNWSELSERLSGALHLQSAPVAIGFADSPPAAPARFAAPMSEPAADGRAGRVAAGCVFWIHGANSSFTTLPEDHGNCSVGRVTHGLASLEEVAGNDDVATLLSSGWVDGEAVGQIPVVTERPGAITYGPLAEAGGESDPDVVLLRVNGRQMMVISDALPALRIEGKPQCHIVAIAKQHHTPAASVGCALSRARTGMTPEEMTVALPAAQLEEHLVAIERAAEIDTGVARYAAQDARRFA